MTVFPPYAWCYGEGWARSNLGEANGGSGFHNPVNSHIVDCATGKLYTRNVCEILQPGDHDRQIVVTHSNIQVNFQSPHAGNLSIVATLVCDDAHVFGSLEDESGVSSANIRQRSYLHMSLPGSVDVNVAEHVLVYYDRGDNGGHWGPWLVANPGQAVQYSYSPNVSYTEGQWATVEIEIYDEQYAGVNDMEFYGEIINSWVLRQVDIT